MAVLGGGCETKHRPFTAMLIINKCCCCEQVISEEQKFFAVVQLDAHNNNTHFMGYSVGYDYHAKEAPSSLQNLLCQPALVIGVWHGAEWLIGERKYSGLRSCFSRFHFLLSTNSPLTPTAPMAAI